MDRFQMATLAQWAGGKGIQGRKRLQKVVYFLQAAGCPLSADFSLHLYGPYSSEVAKVCDEMVSTTLLKEHKEPNAAGMQYRYVLPKDTERLLRKSEGKNPQRANELATFKTFGLELLDEDLKTLELGSTIHYFYAQTKDWSVAEQEACTFKRISVDSELTRKALRLARRAYEFRLQSE